MGKLYGYDYDGWFNPDGPNFTELKPPRADLPELFPRLYGGIWALEPDSNMHRRYSAVLTKFEFLKRFTSDERKAINAAAKVDPDIADFKMLLDAAQEVDCGNEDAIAGVNALEAGGLLAAGRAAVILAP